ncbi:MAG TPA: isochorismate synthase DhbC, partial [Desulfosporosinus sp.]|nr:isochorismate synthase DhbC [Desulfosporosinus sp.]
KHEQNLTLLDKPLLNDYQVGDFFLASPKRTLLGKGSFATVPRGKKKKNQLEYLTERVLAVLENAQEHGYSNPVVVGAVPFDYEKNVQLIVPETIELSSPLQFDSIKPLKSSLASTYKLKSVPEPAQYTEGVEKGLNYIKTGHLSKIVLSRSLHLTSSRRVDIHHLLHNLAQQNTLGYTFAVDLSKPGLDESAANVSFSPGKTLIGASPELLVSRSGLQLMANPLAGSRPRSEDPVEDQRLAVELLCSTKDLHEHEVVVSAVAAALRPYCRTFDVPPQPSLVHTDTMWHLSTSITGELVKPSTSSLELAIALHPTPAVCGSPTELAREAIQEIEPFDREFFAGMVGWCDAKGDGEWAVTIRCAEVESHSLRLFAGAGVVAGSKPDDELAETTAKFGTMLIAMGLKKELLYK